jgi:hypothetical protein
VAHWVGQDGRRVLVLVRSHALDRAGYQLVDRLAELTDPDHLNGSAIFFDIDRTRQDVEAVDFERLLLRDFRAASETAQLPFLLRWGPLDLPAQPRDLWRTLLSPGGHLEEINALLSSHADAHPGDGQSFEVGPPGRELTIEGYATELQGVAFCVYQAVVITLVEMVLSDWPQSLRHGFVKADLVSTPPEVVLRAWRERRLPVPTTVGEALDTMIASLIRASAGFSPRLEVRSQNLDDPLYWHLATGILGALTLQAIHAVSDSAPVRPCKRCGELFQRQTGGLHTQRTQGTVRVKFCSQLCARADAQKRYREKH